jgi:hypothetical protein
MGRETHALYIYRRSSGRGGGVIKGDMQFSILMGAAHLCMHAMSYAGLLARLCRSRRVWMVSARDSSTTPGVARPPTDLLQIEALPRRGSCVIASPGL